MQKNSQDYLRMTVKFGGYLSPVKNQNRSKYNGGKQKTIYLRRSDMTLQMLKEEVGRICDWLEGHNFDLLYHINGVIPKDYTRLGTDIDVLDMNHKSQSVGLVEVVVTTQDCEEVIMHRQGEQVRDVEVVTSLNDEESFEEHNLRGLVVGATFDNAQTFKQSLRTSAISNNFGVTFQASNKRRIIAICSYIGCPWRVRAAINSDGSSFKIRKVCSTHVCPGVNRAGNKQATSSWVANQIEDIIRKNPEISPKHINDTLEKQFGLSLPYMRIWRAREEARNIIFGSVDENYRWVPALQTELMTRNPGSHITFSHSPLDFSFQRFYVSFKVCVDGFLLGCRHLLGLDACHLKSKYLGVLLSASTLDGNHGLLNVAFAVAESESKSSWKWFLECLKVSIGLELENLGFISDMEKGLGEAIKDIFPEAEHRICVRHLWKNLKKFFHCSDSQKVKHLVWSAANVYTPFEHERDMNELYQLAPQIHSYLRSLPFKWCRSAFKEEIRNNSNTNNLSESFNAWICDARNKPVVDLIDMVRSMIMVQRSERKLVASTWRGELVPYAEDYVRSVTTRKDHFIIRQSTQSRAEIEGRNGRHEIDIQMRTCTCRFWQLTGLPCIHAAAFICSKEHSLWHTYIHESYFVSRYKLAYEGAISTLPSKDQWANSYEGLHVRAPKTLRPRGRPKKRRFKNFLENTLGRTKSIHKCGRCGLWGHHKTTCKNPLDLGSPRSQQNSVHESYEDEAFTAIRSRPKLPIRPKAAHA